jgi:hypothetical protein
MMTKKVFRTWLAAVVVLAGLVGATASAAPATAAPAAEAVSMQRTGGHGDHLSVQLAGGGGKAIDEIFRLASSPAFRALRPRYVPKNTCCDRYLYRVEVRYRNGAVKKVEALDGAPGAPKVLWDLVHRMENVSGPVTIDVPAFPFRWPMT